ncbi:MAG: radical SAM protein [Bacteroidota bacterium]|nr:radical SAM protein [Bacteroidota bacterium]
MATILFNEIIFGPVHSRRLGVSLGVNLLPVNGKVCSFDCLYCECGLNKDHKGGHLPKAEEVKEALEIKLKKMKADGIAPDVITFAGNGEPTLHPDFSRIIDDTIELRNAFFPKAKISVLSNATHLDNPSVVEALKKIENPILKLDSAFDKTVQVLNRPLSPAFSVANLVERLKAIDGKIIIQTLFIRGSYEGEPFDNTTEAEVTAWISLVKEIAPESVMIYTIDRETPIKGLVRIPVRELKAIAERLRKETNIRASIAG